VTVAPLRISVAPNGARRSKADHPALPVSSTEIADEAERCADAGAFLLHLHVRDADGAHSLSPDDYRRAIDANQRRVGNRLLLQITTESCGIYNIDSQMAAAAIALGGHVRVGFENNIRRPDGSYLASTAEQVTAVAALARLLHRPIASGE
jgi:uncharacterized protein (DUF849 family)